MPSASLLTAYKRGAAPRRMKFGGWLGIAPRRSEEGTHPKRRPPEGGPVQGAKCYSTAPASQSGSRSSMGKGLVSRYLISLRPCGVNTHQRPLLPLGAGSIMPRSRKSAASVDL